MWLEREGDRPVLAFGSEGETLTVVVDFDDGLWDLSDEALQGFVDEAMRSLMNEMLESVEDATVKSDDSGDPDSGDPDSRASGPSDNPE